MTAQAEKPLEYYAALHRTPRCEACGSLMSEFAPFWLSCSETDVGCKNKEVRPCSGGEARDARLLWSWGEPRKEQERRRAWIEENGGAGDWRSGFPMGECLTVTHVPPSHGD